MHQLIEAMRVHSDPDQVERLPAALTICAVIFLTFILVLRALDQFGFEVFVVLIVICIPLMLVAAWLYSTLFSEVPAQGVHRCQKRQILWRFGV